MSSTDLVVVNGTVTPAAELYDVIRYEEMANRFPVIDSEEMLSAGMAVAELAIKVGMVMQDFAEEKRIPRYRNGKRESVMEHSLFLAVYAPEAAHRLGLDIDLSEVRRFGPLHDILEAFTNGDIATFSLTSEQLAEKERQEAEAVPKALRVLPELAAQTVTAYEGQLSKAARFTRALDKILPTALDIYGSGVRVMREDYGVTSYEDLVKKHNARHTQIAENFGAEFPEVVAAHAVLARMFEQVFQLDEDKDSTQEDHIERTQTELKFLVNPAILKGIDLDGLLKSERIRQGYIATGVEGSDIVVRSYDDERFELIIKGPGSISRSVQPRAVSKEEFESYWEKTIGRRLSKTRYYIPYANGQTIKLDVFDENGDLVIAEVAFDESRVQDAELKANAFVPPAWFDRDVSGDRRFRNSVIAGCKYHWPTDKHSGIMQRQTDGRAERPDIAA